MDLGKVVIMLRLVHDENVWQSLSESKVIAIDAKNATPISAVAYAQNGTSAVSRQPRQRDGTDRRKWHLFYIDANNIIKERVYNNDTNLWSDGPIGDLQLKAMDTENVGLQACWYGSYYGDAVYLHASFPFPSKLVSMKPEDPICL